MCHADLAARAGRLSFPLPSVLGHVSAVTNVLRSANGSTVAVFGAGAFGISAVLGLRLTGAAQEIAVDILLGRASAEGDMRCGERTGSISREPRQRARLRGARLTHREHRIRAPSIPPLVELYQRGQLPVESIVTSFDFARS